MTFVVGMHKQQKNFSTGAMETYVLMSIDVDEFGGLILNWEKVAP